LLTGSRQIERNAAMQRVLVAFVSREGQTEKIAHHVARFLEDRGALVRLIDVTARETEAGADDCDAFLVAGSLQRSRFDPELLGFILRHGAALRSCPSAFLPVSAAAASTDAGERRVLDEATRSFLAETGWTPGGICHLAGAVAKPGLERSPLYAILEGEDADRRSAGDVELTDWTALDDFVRTFLVKVKMDAGWGPIAP
jgi:menaquinone-dependent protoporphyrinogen oxidase